MNIYLEKYIVLPCVCVCLLHSSCHSVAVYLGKWCHTVPIPYYYMACCKNVVFI